MKRVSEPSGQRVYSLPGWDWSFSRRLQGQPQIMLRWIILLRSKACSSLTWLDGIVKRTLVLSPFNHTAGLSQQGQQRQVRGGPRRTVEMTALAQAALLDAFVFVFVAFVFGVGCSLASVHPFPTRVSGRPTGLTGRPASNSGSVAFGPRSAPLAGFCLPCPDYSSACSLPND